MHMANLPVMRSDASLRYRENSSSHQTTSSPSVSCFPEGTFKRAGQLPKALLQRTSHFPNGCLSSAGLFPASGTLAEPGQGSIESRPSGSSMASTSCLAESARGSATLRDYLLINDGSPEAVSSEHPYLSCSDVDGMPCGVLQ